MRPFVRSVAILVTVACASSNAITEPPVYTLVEAADSVKIRVGQTIIVEGVRVQFANVVGDSRCPVDVVCVWAGDAEALFVVELNCDCEAPAHGLNLHTTLDPHSGEAWGFRVTLLQVLPEPRSTSMILPGAYSAWIRMTKLQQ